MPVVWHEIGKKIMFAAIELQTIMNQQLDLVHYGVAVKHLFFVFIAVLPTNKIHTEEQFYTPKDKKIDIYLKLDYPKIEQAQGVVESLPLMATLFLDSIPTYYPKLNIPDFDWQRFALDVKLLFIRKKWITQTLTLAEKQQLTQLPESTIQLIESNPKAVIVNDLLTYCKNLRLKPTIFLS